MKPLSPPHVQGEGSWGREMKRTIGDRLRKAYDVALIKSLDDQKITGEMMRVSGSASEDPIRRVMFLGPWSHT